MGVISYSRHFIGTEDIKKVAGVLKSDWLTQGPKVKVFEDALTTYTGAKYAVAVSSGTAALHIASLAAGIEPGDEVITSPITFVASVNCVLYCGARPVFVDIQPDTANIAPEEVAEKINKRTKAIISVDYSGHPCELEEIQRIAKKYRIIVIEDAAHALGAKYKDSKIGSCQYSDMTIFSFHPLKSITTGEGGAILTNSKDLYEKLLMFRNHGITKQSNKWLNDKMRGCGWYYEMQWLGFNYRLTDIQAALGCSQLRKLDNFIKKRRRIVKLYDRAFKDNPYFTTPFERNYVYSSYHLYPIRIKDKFIDTKKEIFLRMTQARLGVQVHYIPVYLQPYYKKLGFRRGLCPLAEDYYRREISIPIYPSLKHAQVKYIIDSIFDVFRQLNLR